MANPIKDILILDGKDAENFLKEVKNKKHKKVSESIANRMKINYDRLVSITKF